MYIYQKSSLLSFISVLPLFFLLFSAVFFNPGGLKKVSKAIVATRGYLQATGGANIRTGKAFTVARPSRHASAPRSAATG